MRTAPVLVIIFFLVARVEASSLDLTHWIGRYPSDTYERSKSFFEVPEVKKALNKLLTRNEWKRLTDTYSTVSPIESIENHLVVKCCMPHCCPCEHAMLVVDLKRERFHVGFYRGYYQDKTTIQWISSEGEFHDFPKGVQEEFYHGHSAK